MRYANLLPEEQKANLLEEKRFKIILNLILLGLSIFLVFFLNLFWIKIKIESQLIQEESDFEIKKTEYQLSYLKDFENELGEFNKILIKAKPLYHQKEPLLSLLIEKISPSIPEGVYLKNLTYQANNQSVSLSGYAPSREKLLELKENFEKIEEIKNLNFPPSNWIDAEEINFFLSFSLSP